MRPSGTGRSRLQALLGVSEADEFIRALASRCRTNDIESVCASLHRSIPIVDRSDRTREVEKSRREFMKWRRDKRSSRKNDKKNNDKKEFREVISLEKNGKKNNEKKEFREIISLECKAMYDTDMNLRRPPITPRRTIFPPPPLEDDPYRPRPPTAPPLRPIPFTRIGVICKRLDWWYDVSAWLQGLYDLIGQSFDKSYQELNVLDSGPEVLGEGENTRPYWRTRDIVPTNDETYAEICSLQKWFSGPEFLPKIDGIPSTEEIVTISAFKDSHFREMVKHLNHLVYLSELIKDTLMPRVNHNIDMLKAELSIIEANPDRFLEKQYSPKYEGMSDMMPDEKQVGSFYIVPETEEDYHDSDTDDFSEEDESFVDMCETTRQMRVNMLAAQVKGLNLSQSVELEEGKDHSVRLCITKPMLNGTKCDMEEHGPPADLDAVTNGCEAANSSALKDLDIDASLGSSSFRNLLSDNTTDKKVIKVIGVGGGGSTAINKMMVGCSLTGLEFWIFDTNDQVIKMSPLPSQNRLLLGPKLTNGQSTKGDPCTGFNAANESRSFIHEALKGSDIVFLIAGMGAGTGTGGSHVIAEIAKSMDVMIVGIVTMPSENEGRRRIEQAHDGLTTLRNLVDALIIIPIDKLFNVFSDTSETEPFKWADDILQQSNRALIDLMMAPAFVHVDQYDLRAIMQNAGLSLIGIGTAKGKSKARDAALKAVNSPLLHIGIEKATCIILSITGGSDLTESEVQFVAATVSSLADRNAKVIYGAVIDPSLGGQVSVTLIATGFEWQDILSRST